MDLSDVPLELFPGPKGRIALVALEKSAGPLMLLHVLLELFVREKGLPTFLAFYFRQRSSIHVLRWWNMNEPSFVRGFTDARHSYYHVLQNNPFIYTIYYILIR